MVPFAGEDRARDAALLRLAVSGAGMAGLTRRLHER
jgi:hypothetical protein